MIYNEHNLGDIRKDISLKDLLLFIEGRLYTERWKSVDGFDGYYNVSSFGRVKSLNRTIGKRTLKERILKQALKKTGYLNVVLQKEGEAFHFLSHRLVASAFVENIDNKPDVNHEKGIKSINVWLWLKWCTQSENQIHAYKNGLNKKLFGSANTLSKYRGILHPRSRLRRLSE